MEDAAAIVLAGGRSSRMGSSKAALDWHGSTLLRRVTGIVGRAVAGPVVVVRAPGQGLPALEARVEVVADLLDGRGPLQGVAAGLAAIGGRAAVAYVASTDVPLLHPAFVRHVLGALRPHDDVALPHIAGHPQPLAAAYRRELLPVVEGMLAAGRLRLAELFDHCAVRHLAAEEILRDPAVAALDPALDSVRNLNTWAEYERARGLPAPEILVEVASNETHPGSRPVRAWSLGEAATAVGVALDHGAAAKVNGGRVAPDPELPLAAGDEVAFAALDSA